MMWIASGWHARVSLAHTSSHKDSREAFCMFLPQKDNLVFSDCLWKCGVNVTLMIGKCLLQYVLELQGIDCKNNKLWFHYLPQLGFLFLKKMRLGYMTSSWLRFVCPDLQFLGKRGLGLGRYKVKGGETRLWILSLLSFLKININGSHHACASGEVLLSF